MADTTIPQAPTAGAPSPDALAAAWPPAPSTDDPDTHTWEDLLRGLLAGREEDFYGSFQPASAFLAADVLDRRGTWTLATNSSGAPTDQDSANLRDLADGDYTLCFSTTMRSDADNNVWALEPAKGAADYPGGRDIYVHIPGDPKNYGKTTLTGAGTLVGQGYAAYIYMPVTLDEVGDLYDDGDWNRFSELAPPDIAIDSALLTSLAALILRLADIIEQGGDVAAAIRKAIQGLNETAVLAGVFVMKVSAGGTYEVQDNGSGTGGLFVRLPTIGADQDIADIDRVIHTTTWIEFGAWRVVPSGNISKSHFSDAIQYTFDYLVIDGAKPAVDSTFSVTLDGADAHRGEFVRQVFRAWAVTIGGKGRGGEGDLWMAAANDTGASWTSTAAKRAKARAALNTGRLDKDIAGSGALALTAEDLGHDLIRLTGVKTGDRVLSVPADKPVGVIVIRNESTGAGHITRIKVATQADEAALVLPAGDSVLIAQGGSLSRLRHAPIAPTAGTHRTATHALGGDDIGKWNSYKATAGIEISLDGALGELGDTLVLALRSMGNHDIDLKWVSGTLKVYSALGIAELTAAGTTELLGSGGNQRAVYTCMKTGASEWTLWEGVWIPS